MPCLTRTHVPLRNGNWDCGLNWPVQGGTITTGFVRINIYWMRALTSYCYLKKRLGAIKAKIMLFDVFQSSLLLCQKKEQKLKSTNQKKSWLPNVVVYCNSVGGNAAVLGWMVAFAPCGDKFGAVNVEFIFRKLTLEHYRMYQKKPLRLGLIVV